MRAMTSSDRQLPIPLLSIAGISCAALGLEVLLMRLFAIVQWHHFAYLAVGLALLGYGTAGTALAVAGDRLRRRVPQLFVASAVLFGVSAPLAFLLAQAVPFNALEILWNPRQALWLALQTAVLLLPFFFAAICLCLVFSHFGRAAPRVYGADLWGAAGGAVLALALLFLLPPQRVLLLLAALPLLAAALAWRQPPWAGRLLLVVALALPWLPPADWLALQPSQFKSLTQTLLLPGARVAAQHYGPMGQVTMVESPQVPLRHAPGLSLLAEREPPAQLGVFVDGEGPAAITRFDGDLEKLSFLGQMPSALPFRLLDKPQVLVLGGGAGMDALQALYHGAARVDVVELNAQLAAMVHDDAAQYSGHLYHLPQVRLHVAEARSFMAADASRHDLIVLPLASSQAATSTGLHGLAEDYLHTVQALRAYYRHLQAGGMLAFNSWLQLPPRDLIKLAATAVEALEQEGVREPLRHLALLRSWQSAVLLVKREPFTLQEVAAMRDFADTWSFDLEWAGGEVAGWVPYHRLDRPYFAEAFAALAGSQRQDFYRRYKFDIVPPDDDRPYFHHFFRWSSLPEMLELRKRGGLSLVEMGYPVLLATLAQALLLSVLLILLPLWLARGRRMPAGGRGRVFAYFAALGLAFMLMEMAFLQKLALFLGHPLYAAVAVLTVFLLFAGAGSRVSARLAGRAAGGLSWPVAGIVLWGLLCLAAFPLLAGQGMGWPLALRLAASVALIAPLAFCMGMPFPMGMVRLASTHAEHLPWAYGVNACFSVVAAPLATVLAIAVGFAGVVWLAMGLYLAALAVFAWPAASATGRT